MFSSQTTKQTVVSKQGSVYETNIAVQIRLLLWAVIILLGILIAFRVFASAKAFLSSQHAIMFVFILFMLGLLRLLKRGQVRLVSLIFVGCMWLGLSALAWNAGGIKDVAFIAQTLTILLSSLILGAKESIWIIVLTIVNGWALAVADLQGFIQFSEEDAISMAFEMTIIYTMVGVLIYLIINNLSFAIQQAYESNEKLQTLTQTLEAQVSDRTQLAEQARQEAELTQQQMIEQLWLTTGQAKLSEAMRGEHTTASLAQQVIRCLCQYMNLPVGSVFVTEGTSLVWKAGFSYTPTTNEEPIIRFGEGLVGEVAQTQRPLSLSDLPPTYLNVLTGTSIHQPGYAMIYPFVYNNRVMAVVELGNWQPFTAQERLFLDRIAESVGITFYTAQTHSSI